MRHELVIALLSATLAIIGCSKTTSQSPSGNAPQAAVTHSATSPAAVGPVIQGTPANATVVKPKVDACSLLTSQEIESVQGEPTRETKLSGQSASGFIMSQCFFTLPTFTNSVSLLVAQKGEGAGAADPKEFFRDTFHENNREDKEKEKERGGKKAREEEEEESTPPQKVAGIGDEAYWTGSRVGGALYVLKGNSYIRISIGGPADQTTKIRKSKALAAKAIARL
jgi:hypothetical protein